MSNEILLGCSTLQFSWLVRQHHENSLKQTILPPVTVVALLGNM
jgi:hypothetical protein